MEMPPHHPLTLRFQSDRLEAAFRHDYVQRSLRQVRFALLLGVAMYGLVFGAMDLLIAPTIAPEAWTIRGIVCGAAMGVFALTYGPAFTRLMQPVLAGLLLMAGAGLLLMLALDGSGQNYYDGPVLVILPAYVAVRLRFAYATAVGWLIWAGLVAVLIWVEGAAAGPLLSAAIFFAAANAIGMFAGYMLEDYARRQFWQARVIDAKRKENKQLLQTRSRFFANVSHEFRTPLTLILGPLENLLADESDLPEAHRAPLRVMQKSARRLLRLIGQLLDLAKLEAGRLRLHAQPTPLAPFLSGVAHAFSAHAERQGIDLRVETGAAEAADVYADRDKLEKIVSNLLANALAFTPAGGTVRLGLEVAPEAVTIRVRDTGPGIPEEDLPHLFDRFHRADGSSLRQQDGTGIGLALTKELAELHGGSVTVESDPGFGSTFTVTLSRGRAHLQDADLVPEDEATFEIAPPDAAEADVSGADLPPAPRRTPALDEVADALADAATTILVVEDDADVRAYVRESLAADYAVAEAHDGADGLEKARALVPDLVVSDVMMPGMDGYAFTRALKGDHALDHIPVVLLTAKAAEEHTLEGLGTGADDYLTKPFSTPELKARVKSLLENRRRLRRRFSQEVLTQPPAIEASPVEVQSADERFIEDARAVVEDHLDDENFSVDAFAEEMGLSRRQLQRKLKALTGETPNAFIRLIRLGRGAQLVAQEYGTISEIAYAVGFSSPSYFTKCFRETFGVPPTEYEADGPDDGLT